MAPPPTEIAPTGDAAFAADIEARIAADPSDIAAYAVYADWLAGKGDPRGELIALALARDAEPPPATGKKRASTRDRAIARLVERHAAALVGDLPARLGDVATGALVDLRQVPEQIDVHDASAEPLVWRLGFIHRVVLQSRPGRELGAIIEAIVGHPSGRFVREIAVRSHDLDEAHRVIDAIAALPRPALRTLELVVRGERVDLGALWPAVGGLRQVSIAARSFDLGAIHTPAAERARFASMRLAVDTLRSISVAPWPVLQRLELRFAGRFSPSSTTIEDLTPLLARTDLSRLTHLRLRSCIFAGEALTALAESPLAAQLLVIDLSGGHVERADLRQLAGRTRSFPQLRELWLPRAIFAEARTALDGIATHVISEQHAALDRFADEIGDPRSA